MYFNNVWMYACVKQCVWDLPFKLNNNQKLRFPPLSITFYNFMKWLLSPLAHLLTTKVIKRHAIAVCVSPTPTSRQVCLIRAQNAGELRHPFCTRNICDFFVARENCLKFSRLSLLCSTIRVLYPWRLAPHCRSAQVDKQRRSIPSAFYMLSGISPSDEYGRKEMSSRVFPNVLSCWTTLAKQTYQYGEKNELFVVFCILVWDCFV